MEILWWIVLIWAAVWYVSHQYKPGQSEKKLLETKHKLDALLLLQKAAKEGEKEQRVRIRETRVKRKNHLTIRARELKAIEKVLKPEDRTTLKMLPLEQRRGAYTMMGLREETVEKWLEMSPAELERQKMGLE